MPEKPKLFRSIIFAAVMAVTLAGSSAFAQRSSGFGADFDKSGRKNNKEETIVPTKILVRVVAHDAKVINDHVGGAKVIIKDSASGKILAEGVQKGGSGDTNIIMRQPRTRDAKIFDTPDTAGFTATLNPDKPTLIDIIAEGPLSYPESLQRSSKTILLIPGQDILGEGVLLELQGLIVVMKTDQPVLRIPAAQPFDLQITVMMMCGCPIQPDGIWDANRVKVTAQIRRGKTIVEEFPLTYAGRQSTFTGKLTSKEPGKYEIRITAFDIAGSNSGMMQQKIVVE